ncbi:MAG: hypothetical protein B6245_12260 [Desulfobacteraceae bacterium 4572_88]|nr:MAG: hypothetical protein B6245_12260 [Desulfobacteraceae bacterium 4572_88]
MRIATPQVQYAEQMADDAEVEICPLPDMTISALSTLGVGQAEAIVTMLSDEENYQICELAYEHYGIQNMIVRLNSRTYLKRFHELGALIVDPSTAIVSLLDQFVRSPSAASLLLGQEQDRDVIEFELRNRDLHRFAIRDLHLPLDLHILSVRRRGQLLVSGGFTRLRLRDWVTVVGSPESLQQMMLKFDASREHETLHLVERATSRELATGSLKTEVRAIHDEKQDVQGTRFDHLIRDSVVLDIPHAISCEDFFDRAAEALSPKIGSPPDELLQLLLEREKESGTALRPDLAIPHIIIEGEHTLEILLARCREGIHFSELAPRVQAVFVLAGTRDERNYHLYVLSAIARIVQAGQFEKRWLNARSSKALQNVVRQLRVKQCR